MDICRSNVMRIPNGRIVGDLFVNYTYYSLHGASTVDYTIITTQLLRRVRDSAIEDLDIMLSDHCLKDLA